MQRIAQEFLQFKRGMLLRNILENSSVFSKGKPNTVSNLFGTSSTLNKKKSSSSASPSQNKCKKCMETFKCKRGRLPWETDKKIKKPKATLPFLKVADAYVGSSSSEVSPCRFCAPSAIPKPRKKKVKKGPEDCKPYHGQNSAEKLSVCEKRRITKCRKKSCKPEIECKNLKPACKRITKTYPSLYITRKVITGCPIKGWKVIHKKARAECKKQNE